ncbi:MAG: hypothetical protein U0P45_16680 [Acidimicrobiales bacterium]
MDDATDLDERAPAADEPEGDGAAAGDDGGVEATDGGPGGVSLNQVVGLLLAIVGLRIGLDSLHDNSFFTHLATGRWILDHHSIPRRDIYSFTAHGHPWTVQSWGASVIYALTQRVAGDVGLRALVAACTTAMAVLVWRLTSRAEGLVGRLAIAVPAIAVGASLWVERPLIFSLLFLMAVLFAVEDRLDPRWLLPIMWCWVNVHGSFPIGPHIVAFGFGRLLTESVPPGGAAGPGLGLPRGTVLAAWSRRSGPACRAPRAAAPAARGVQPDVERQPPHWDDQSAVLRAPARPGRRADPLAEPSVAQHRAGGAVRRHVAAGAQAATSSTPASPSSRRWPSLQMRAGPHRREPALPILRPVRWALVAVVVVGRPARHAELRPAGLSGEGLPPGCRRTACWTATTGS